jgi:hypothetical protein
LISGYYMTPGDCCLPAVLKEDAMPANAGNPD